MDDISTIVVIYTLVLVIIQLHEIGIDVMNYYDDLRYFDDLDILRKLDSGGNV